MPRWIHQETGASQWDFPNLMKFEIKVLSGQPLLPGKMEEWSNLPTDIWAPINCPLPHLLHILLQRHPLGSLSEFRDNSMVALQQRSPQGIFLRPHFFNHGDTHEERKRRQISQLIQKATGLQIPGTPLPIHAYPAIPCTAVLPGSSDEGNLNQYLVDFQIVTVTGTPLPTLRKGLETARASAS